MKSPFNKIVVLLVAAFANAALLTGCGGGGGTSATQTPAAPNSVAQTPATTSDIATTNTDAVQPRMIGNDRRMAVVYECWYALRQGWLNPNGQTTPASAGPPAGGKSIGTDIVSDWRYLSPAADQNSNALLFALKTYGYDVSWLFPGDGPIPSSQLGNCVKQLSSDNYALGLNYAPNGGSPTYTGYGHGCECVAFVSMILYRALGGTYTTAWVYPAVGNSCPLATTAVPGDIVFYNGGTSTTQHVAICVGVSGNNVTVVDSNYVGSTGQGVPKQEVIGRHTVALIAGKDTHNNVWKCYSGKGRWY